MSRILKPPPILIIPPDMPLKDVKRLAEAYYRKWKRKEKIKGGYVGSTAEAQRLKL